MRSQETVSRAAGLVAACVQAACAASPPSAPTALLPQSEANIVLTSVVVDRLIDGRLVSSGTAAEVTYRRSGGRFEASDVRAVVRAAPGEGERVAAGVQGGPLGDLTLAAPRASGALDARGFANHARAEGGVTLRAARGDRLDTDHAELDGPAGLLRADAAVALVGPGYQTRAASGTVRTDGSVVELRGGVTGELTGQAPSPGPAPRKARR